MSTNKESSKMIDLTDEHKKETYDKQLTMSNNKEKKYS